MEITGKIEDGKISISQEILTEMGVKEGDRVTLKYDENKPSNCKTLFGAMKGKIAILGDIVSPIDVEWDAEK